MIDKLKILEINMDGKKILEIKDIIKNSEEQGKTLFERKKMLAEYLGATVDDIDAYINSVVYGMDTTKLQPISAEDLHSIPTKYLLNEISRRCN